MQLCTISVCHLFPNRLWLAWTSNTHLDWPSLRTPCTGQTGRHRAFMWLTKRRGPNEAFCSVTWHTPWTSKSSTETGSKVGAAKSFWISCCWSLLNSAILRSRADSLCSHVILHEWIAFNSALFEYPPKWCTYSAGMAGATWNCCLLGTFCVHHTTMHHATSCKATYVRCMCILAVTCHLHFWQNDQGLLCAAVVTWGWNGYWNKSQHRKLTLEKKILPPLLQGFEPMTFWSWVRRSNRWAIPAPRGTFSGVFFKSKLARCHK